MMPIIDATHDATRTSWVAGADAHPDFPIQNLPLGIFAPADGTARAGTAIGDHILDLTAIRHLLPEPAAGALGEETLNILLALPSTARLALRRRLSELLSDAAHRDALSPHLHAAADCTLHLPARIGDYTDFYVGIHHATNIGKQFRPDQPLLPNYKHIPIGYHGRASSVRPSGTDVVRPKGQRKAPDADAPDFGPSRRLDYELEIGVWVGFGNALGSSIAIGDAWEHIAGVSLLNDWSARDLQAWEYQPLGPFLAKNFLTSVSPWIVTSEALAPYRVAQPPRPDGDPRPLPYLWDEGDQAMRAAGHVPQWLSTGPATNMYWTVAQMIAHHSANGCNLSPGDLLGTGTISAATPDGYGSLMEISQGGKTPLTLPTGETRSFLEDGDELTLAARATAPGRVGIGLGICTGRVRPAT
jgi:fumarylacetoacetase